MDLNITDQRFVVCGASSGFGEAIARQLLIEGAHVVLVARRGNLLQEKFGHFEDQIEIIGGSLIYNETLDAIEKAVKQKDTHGIVFNAGGPPTGTPLQTDMKDWDSAWQLVMRWKVDLALRVAPLLRDKEYGRMLFVESQSVKQPLPALTLSNSFRAGIVGFAKSLALEIAPDGVTVNVLAPGSHETPAIERVIKNNSESKDISYDEAKKEMEKQVPVGRMGTAEEFASLASWLLSPHAGYVTGQTISHDGGNIKGLFG
ncbi:SDR family oxidoreductase [Gracilimonas mengyeensis]|uniref:3-oxoacyl-[acyl-carrier protein] reductase n=1 Tax=Gracilimonas mengyeensis TaxID=1302730 RepID=A0A521E5J2_9BACT|nr:SDR family oxidoreductase [Gracilimonas mengyeensis]SMO79132.1 3-oxoacyl-[acyl-carrier protein] reductase [Gracilimonas mengyeensis]